MTRPSLLWFSAGFVITWVSVFILKYPSTGTALSSPANGSHYSEWGFPESQETNATCYAIYKMRMLKCPPCSCLLQPISWKSGANLETYNRGHSSDRSYSCSKLSVPTLVTKGSSELPVLTENMEDSEISSWGFEDEQGNTEHYFFFLCSSSCGKYTLPVINALHSAGLQ